GLVQWNQTRQQWVGNKKRKSRLEKPREPKIR
uniref:Gag1-like clamp domain-containing protein n=1 Tax=Aegilops tauschii subsp. strangulata TaxID=200361 RepID=A0A453SFI9_AEGTS